MPDRQTFQGKRFVETRSCFWNVRDVWMMTTFRLSDKEAGWRHAVKTPVTIKVLHGTCQIYASR